jgi:hypothetical protein
MAVGENPPEAADVIDDHQTSHLALHHLARSPGNGRILPTGLQRGGHDPAHLIPEQLRRPGGGDQTGTVGEIALIQQPHAVCQEGVEKSGKFGMAVNQSLQIAAVDAQAGQRLFGPCRSRIALAGKHHGFTEEIEDPSQADGGLHPAIVFDENFDQALRDDEKTIAAGISLAKDINSVIVHSMAPFQPSADTTP